MKFLIFAALILSARCFQISGLLGKLADPCADNLWDRQNAAGTWTTAWRNCPEAGKPLIYPTSATTVLLPQGNSHPTLNVDQTVPINGRNFDVLKRLTGVAPATPGVIGRLCVGVRAQPNRYCVPNGGAATACDPAFNIITINDLTPNVNATAGTVTIPLTGLNGWQNIPTSEAPRPLCVLSSKPAVAPPQPLPDLEFWSGLTIATVAHCSSDIDCKGRTAALGSIATSAELAGATVCCTGSPQVWATPSTAVVQACINPNIQGCCGGSPFSNNQEKCCNSARQATAFIDSPCFCAATQDCNVTLGERCCLRTKYDSFVQVSSDRLTSGWGQCYQPANEQCCNTGQRFDPGSHQCCAISGLQSLEQPCPCSSDDNCADPTGTRTNLECCRGSYPNNSPINKDRCEVFSQFPSAGVPSSNPVVQGCAGVCIDRRYQTCCYGTACMREYERCCNSTCCNRFVGTCKNARRSGATGFPSNPTEFAEGGSGPEYLYLQCSTVEHLDTTKGFLLFALPAILLASSLSGLGLALVFANKSSPRRYSFLERTLITFAVISVFLILPVFFSPLYKYAEVIVIASIVAVITAAVRVRWLNLFAIIILAVTVIYIFDPFYGNALLTLAYNRVFPAMTATSAPTDYFLSQQDLLTAGFPDVETSGLLHATAQLHMDSAQALTRRACVTFYDYFVVDQSLLDLDRRDLKENVTFGYCSRAYVIALLFFEGIAAIFVLLQLVVALLAIIVRFRKQKFDPIELEVMAVPVDD